MNELNYDSIIDICNSINSDLFFQNHRGKEYSIKIGLLPEDIELTNQLDSKEDTTEDIEQTNQLDRTDTTHLVFDRLGSSTDFFTS